MKQEQFIEQQIKNIFKISKHFYRTFKDIRKQSKKFLKRMMKLSVKKKLYNEQWEKNRKKEEIEKKKKQRMEQKKLQKQKQKQKDKQKQKENEIATQMNELNQALKPQQKSIISIINQDRTKLKSNRPKQNKQEKTNQIKLKKDLPNQNKQKQKSQQKLFQKKKAEKQVNNLKQSNGKILEKPVQPEAPYYRFLRMKKNEIKSTIMGDRSAGQTMQIIRSVWDKMRDEEKRQYVQSYEIDKAKYQRDLNLYYKQNEKKEKNEAKNDEKQKKAKDSVIVGFDYIDQLYK